MIMICKCVYRLRKQFFLQPVRESCKIISEFIESGGYGSIVGRSGLPDEIGNTGRRGEHVYDCLSSR